jgi:hypothetical protein
VQAKGTIVDHRNAVQPKDNVDHQNTVQAKGQLLIIGMQCKPKDSVDHRNANQGTVMSGMQLQ